MSAETDVTTYQAELAPDECELIINGVKSILGGSGDLYDRLNNLRDWINVRFPDFDFYLEDVWNENVAGETHFEQILRSRKTLNETRVLAYDVYVNHQDDGGVWHLGDYQHSVLVMNDPKEIVDFIQANI